MGGRRRGAAACESGGGTPSDGPLGLLFRGTASLVGRIQQISFAGPLIGTAIDIEGWCRTRVRRRQAPHRRAAALPARLARPVTYLDPPPSLLIQITLPRSPPLCCSSFSFLSFTPFLPASCGPRTGLGLG